MHYYSHNIGDYARDTSHLTIIEHGIYRLLLDWCYLNEKPIPTERALRVGRGYPTETQSVLSEFFTETAEGWEQGRVSKEIAKYHRKAETNRRNGSKGGRPKANENPVGSDSPPSRNPNQEPITNNQQKEQKKKQAARSAPVFVAAPEWLDPVAWAEWCAYRKGARWKESAQRYSLAELDKLRRDGHDPPAVIRQSIAAGWTGLFPLKHTGARHEPHRNLSAVDRVRASAIAGELADRAADWGNRDPDAVGPDGGDLRPPLDL